MKRHRKEYYAWEEVGIESGLVVPGKRTVVSVEAWVMLLFAGNTEALVMLE
jgi:hypothetical protein